MNVVVVAVGSAAKSGGTEILARYVLAGLQLRLARDGAFPRRFVLRFEFLHHDAPAFTVTATSMPCWTIKLDLHITKFPISNMQRQFWPQLLFVQVTYSWRPSASA